MFQIDQTEQVWDSFESEILKERMKYKNIYEIIEKYISEFNGKTQIQEDKNQTQEDKPQTKKTQKKEDKNQNQEDKPQTKKTQTQEDKDSRIIVGGGMAISLIMCERGLDDFVYTVYTETPFKHANDLINIIAKKLEEPENIKSSCDSIKLILYLKTFEANIHYSIFINQRPFVHFRIIKSPDANSSAIDLINPPVKKSFSGKYSFLIMPPRFHLIERYQMLYSPQSAECWLPVLQEESRLYKYLKSRVKSITGAAEASNRINKDRLQYLVLTKFIANNYNVVILGDTAVNILLNKTGGINIISIFSTFSASEIKQKLIEILESEFPDISITYYYQNVNVLSDTRLKRIAFKFGDKETDFMYFFNSACFELIPFNSITSAKYGFLQIANPFVIMRFLLIDIWIIHWILSMNKIDKNFAENKIARLLKSVIDVRGLITDSKTSEIAAGAVNAGATQIFQKSRDNYIGVYVNETIYKKNKIQKQSSKIIRDYYPQEYFLNNSQYRELNF